MLFGTSAIFFTQATLWGSILIVGIILLGLEIAVEAMGLLGKTYQPIIGSLRKILQKEAAQETRKSTHL